MDGNSILVTIGSIILSLTVTFVFNYFVGLPKKWKDGKEKDKKMIDNLILRVDANEQEIKKVKEVVDELPAYRKQSLEIQKKLKDADVEITKICEKISNEVIKNRDEVMGTLGRLEGRERNSLRSKIIDEYRLYTNEAKNPRKAWTEMERDAFNNLVEDYLSLGGNGYVQNTIVPEMDKLDVVSMSNLVAVKALYDSRKI